LMGQSEIVLLVSSDPGLPHCISPQHDGWQYLVFTWPKWTVYPASSLLLSSHRRSQLEPQSHTIVAKTRPAKTAQGSQRLTAFRQSLGCVRILYQAHRAQAANPTDCQTLDQDRNTVSIAHLPCTGGGGGFSGGAYRVHYFTSIQINSPWLVLCLSINSPVWQSLACFVLDHLINSPFRACLAMQPADSHPFLTPTPWLSIASTLCHILHLVTLWPVLNFSNITRPVRKFCCQGGVCCQVPPRIHCFTRAIRMYNPLRACLK
jgi:hypothetical protein